MKSPNHPAAGFGADLLGATRAVHRALRKATETVRDDLLFLEAFEHGPAGEATLASLQRARQLRRANPGLAASLRAQTPRGSLAGAA